jgi:hypothetical protein
MEREKSRGFESIKSTRQAFDIDYLLLILPEVHG